MKQLKYDTKIINGSSTLQAIMKLWRSNFLNEANKFISTTHLKPEDLYKEFKDHKGETWKLLGYIDGRDMPCEKVSTGEMFIWDRWKVSSLMQPELHALGAKKTETFHPAVIKPKRGRKAAEKIIEKTDETQETHTETDQLGLFSSTV